MRVAAMRPFKPNVRVRAPGGPPNLRPACVIGWQIGRIPWFESRLAQWFRVSRVCGGYRACRLVVGRRQNFLFPVSKLAVCTSPTPRPEKFDSFTGNQFLWAVSSERNE